jgi:hypothetical protein
MKSTATTVNEYLAELAPERRAVVEPVLELVRKNLPEGFQEVMNWGMICWEVPLSTYPATYNGQPLTFGGLASQKNYISLYLMGLYMNPKLMAMLDNSGKKLKMGKACINFKRVDELPLAEIAEIIRSCKLEEFIETHERQYARKK